MLHMETQQSKVKLSDFVEATQRQRMTSASGTAAVEGTKQACRSVPQQVGVDIDVAVAVAAAEAKGRMIEVTKGWEKLRERMRSADQTVAQGLGRPSVRIAIVEKARWRDQPHWTTPRRKAGADELADSSMTKGIGELVLQSVVEIGILALTVVPAAAAEHTEIHFAVHSAVES